MSEINPEIFKNLFEQLKKQKLRDDETLLNLELDKGDCFDRAMDERNNALLVKLKARTSIFIKKIDMALERIEDGSFGTCEECDNKISEERLFARPTAQLCIQCKEEQESIEKDLPYNKRSHTLGKSLVTDLTINNLGQGLDGGASLTQEQLMIKKSIGL